MIDIQQFIKEQLASWPLAQRNFEALQQVRTRTLLVEDSPVRLQFNPARAVSSQAKLDAKSLAERPCFLCKHNRPTEQHVVELLGRYDLLVNPFPITPGHCTIAAKEHRPQVMDALAMMDFLVLAQAFEGHTLLFNGAHSGASAPDHFHFQLTDTSFYLLPLTTPQPYLRKLNWTSDNPEELLHAWQATAHDQAYSNFFVRYTEGKWTLTLYPRRQHRPHQYTDGTLLISPGAIDMTGTLIVTRESDFEQITAEDIHDIYRQVSAL